MFIIRTGWLISLVLSGSMFAQVPRPYVAGSVNVNGGGYSSISESIGAGIDLESAHANGNLEATYDNAKKVNDGTVNNHNGRVRSAQARAFYRLHNGLYFGGGVQWSELNTTNYSKQGWRPTAGIGKDFLRDTYSIRLQSLYISKGSDKSNGTQGVETAIYFPSPSTKGHVFLRDTIAIYRFHATITDFNSPSLVAQETAERAWTAYDTVSLIVRF